MTKAYDKVAEGLREALAIAEGEKDAVRMDGMTQEEAVRRLLAAREALGYVEPVRNGEGLRISHDAYDNLHGGSAPIIACTLRGIFRRAASFMTRW